MSERELLLRIDRLEAIEQIRRLKAQYFAYCDNNYDPDGIASLFTEDAVWEGGSFGHYKGREEIREHFQRVSREIVFAAHLGMNAIIDVNGDTASAQWRMIMPSVVVEKGAKEARWLLVAYDDAFAKLHGSWLFTASRNRINFYTPHLDSWAETAVP
jgi:uncharacterized protein (TIGR02246 family)